MLKDKLHNLKTAATNNIPAASMEIMLNSRLSLTASNILERAIKVGDWAPDFTLDDATGKPVSLALLRQRGPVVISIYRGVW